MIRPDYRFSLLILIRLVEVYNREAIQSQCLPPTLYMNLIATYISGVSIIRAFNIDDLFHTGRIDPPGMVKIVYIVCTYMHNDTGSQPYIVLWSKTAANIIGVFFCNHFFFCLVRSLEKKNKKILNKINKCLELCEALQAIIFIWGMQNGTVMFSMI